MPLNTLALLEQFGQLVASAILADLRTAMPVGGELEGRVRAAAQLAHASFARALTDDVREVLERPLDGLPP